MKKTTLHLILINLVIPILLLNTACETRITEVDMDDTGYALMPLDMDVTVFVHQDYETDILVELWLPNGWKVENDRIEVVDSNYNFTIERMDTLSERKREGYFLWMGKTDQRNFDSTSWVNGTIRLIPGVTTGDYRLSLRILYSCESGFCAMQGTYPEVRILSPIAPSDLEGTYDRSSIYFNWKKPLITNNIKGYFLYRENERVSDLITDTNFQLKNPKQGIYDYYISAVYDSLILEERNSTPFRLFSGEEIWVTPEGSDENPGTREKPLATINQALDHIQGDAENPVTIRLGRGTYYDQANGPIEWKSHTSLEGSANGSTLFQSYGYVFDADSIEGAEIRNIDFVGDERVSSWILRSSHSEVTFKNVTINGFHELGRFTESVIQFNNSLITEMKSPSLMVNVDSRTSLVNCTMVREDGVRIQNYGLKQVIVLNSIIIGAVESLGNVYIDYSNVQWNGDGDGNISTDPMFNTDTTSYYQIMEGSPCVDAGHPGTFHQDAYGFGSERNDMGIHGGPFGKRLSRSVSKSAEDLAMQISFTNFPNPFREKTTISFYLSEASYVKLDLLTDGGILINTLVEGEMGSGTYERILERGNLRRGIYYLRLQVNNRIMMRRIVSG